MISPLSTGATGDAGVHGVGLLVNTQLGWRFRAQPDGDVGIDAQAEAVVNKVETGRLLGLQIKGGPSWFKTPVSDGTGWWFRERSQRLRRYWLRYRLPVILVLYDIETHTAYWQVINEDTAEVIGIGFKVFVPRSQRIDAGSATALAALAREVPADPFTKHMADLPAPCADSLIILREYAPALAQELAEVLLSGRDDPVAAVQRLQKRGSATWPWRAWSAMADYAAEYDLNMLAADCLLQGVTVCDDGSTRARITAFAGIHQIAADSDQARELLTEASASSGGALLSAVGLATLDHGHRDGPVPIPATLAEDPEQVEADATIQRFLADNAARRGDTDAAIGFHENALALAPQSSKQMLALAEALLRRREPVPGSTNLADYQRAASLAEQARAARRRCLADSVPAATILLHAVNLCGDERSAIRVAEPAPDGEATEVEAASPELAFHAARLYYETGDVAAGDRFEATIARAGKVEWIAHCAAMV